MSEHVTAVAEEAANPINFNKVIVIGEITDIEFRAAGSAMVWVRSSNRDEVPMDGSPVPSVFTPIVLIRLPRPIAERMNKEEAVPRAVISVEARVQGVRRTVDGKMFFFTEIVASSAKVMALAPETIAARAAAAEESAA